VTATFALGCFRVVLCSYWSVPKKLGHDSVFGVLIARGGFSGRPLVQ